MRGREGKGEEGRQPKLDKDYAARGRLRLTLRGNAKKETFDAAGLPYPKGESIKRPTFSKKKIDSMEFVGARRGAEVYLQKEKKARAGARQAVLNRRDRQPLIM